MNDDLDGRLRDRVQTTPLPAAPASLRDFATDLADQPATVRPRPSLRALAVLIPIALVAAGFAIVGGVVPVPVTSPFAQASGSPSVGPSSVAASLAASPAVIVDVPTPSPGGEPPPETPVGFRHLSFPGIELDVPQEWVDVTAWGVGTYEIRNVAWLIDGVDDCPGPAPTPAPNASSVAPCLSSAGRDPGSIEFRVVEYLNPLPMGPITGQPTTIDGHPAWSNEGGSGDVVGRYWIVEGLNGSLYWISTMFPRVDVTTRQAQLDAVIGGLRFTGWQAEPAPVIDGRVHFDAGLGFTFDYPAGWHLYFPGGHSFGGGTTRLFLLTHPVDACFLTPCGGYAAQAQTMVISFSQGGGFGTPDWTKADSTVGGQPAIRGDRTDSATPDVVMHNWLVKYGSSTIGIQAWIRGPGTDAFELQLERFIESVDIEPPPEGGP